MNSDDAAALTRWLQWQRLDLEMERLIGRLEQAADEQKAAERKELTFREIKLLPEGRFSGLAATYHNVDEVGDRILPGAFTDSLAERRDYPLYFGHDFQVPLGIVHLTDTPQGLSVEARLDTSLRRVQEIFLLIKSGALRGLSIGFDTLASFIRDGIRHLTAIRLHEVSLTTSPANPLALVSSVKSRRSRWEDGVRLGWALPAESE